jgi:hypothetical protein
MIYIKPVLEYLSVECKPLDGEGVLYAVRMNYTDELFGETTAILVRPESQGRYNLTINFRSDFIWDYTVGVYMQDIDFYLDFYGKNLQTNGDFAELAGPHTRLSGNWTIMIVIDSYSRFPSIFSIELPTPINLALLVTIAGFVLYFNVFLFLDNYFRSKKEIISNKRWIIIIIIAVISAWAIYYLYNFTTFTLTWRV